MWNVIEFNYQFDKSFTGEKIIEKMTEVGKDRGYHLESRIAYGKTLSKDNGKELARSLKIKVTLEDGFLSNKLIYGETNNSEGLKINEDEDYKALNGNIKKTGPIFKSQEIKQQDIEQVNDYLKEVEKELKK